MKILLVEDDDHKARQVSAFMNALRPNVQIDSAGSVNEGMCLLEENLYDLVLLDMSLRTYTVRPGEHGGRPQGFGGREVLRFMDRREISTPVVVITQYEELGDGKEKMDIPTLDARLSMEHPDTFKGTVYFNVASDRWRVDLTSMLTTALAVSSTDYRGNEPAS